MFLVAEFCPHKPVRRKFCRAVRHILAAKHSEREHFLRGKLRFEIGCKVFAGRLGAPVYVSVLHEIAYDDAFRFHTAIIMDNEPPVKVEYRPWPT